MPNFVRFEGPDGTVRAGLLQDAEVRAVHEPFWESVEETGEQFALADVRLLAPALPRTIVCVGLNYASHLGGRPVPDPPTLFFKPLSSLAGPGDEIVLPPDAGRVDPEGEVVIVIGKELRNAAAVEALAGIFGYTCGNDVSAREWQSADGQWWRAKGSDTFGILGPSIVTGLEHDRIELRTVVNGEEVQHATTDELIIDIPGIVSLVSNHLTLVPGDVIYTGTPGSPQPLSPGDVVEIEITGAGILQNRVAAITP